MVDVHDHLKKKTLRTLKRLRKKLGFKTRSEAIDAIVETYDNYHYDEKKEHEWFEKNRRERLERLKRVH